MALRFDACRGTRLRAGGRNLLCFFGLRDEGPLSPSPCRGYCRHAIHQRRRPESMVHGSFFWNRGGLRPCLDLLTVALARTEGDGVLSDLLAVTIEDESAEGEQRFVTLGANTFGSLMVVVLDISGRQCSHYLGSETDTKGKKDI